MEVKKEKIRYILQYHYDQGDKAQQAAKKICDVYGPNTVSNATAKRWFRRFRSGNMDIEDETRSGRPIVENVDKIMEIVESDRNASTYSIAQELNISQKTVWNHLHKAGLKKDLDNMSTKRKLPPAKKPANKRSKKKEESDVDSDLTTG
ncbi:PREDICTED: histone-lysine N-methyltransferase SETMAR-like isoform X2 [Nicrophorus vespilloides]|uniref:Histone-lysine N-methyltransferase SETMAR-like isoform X2 n=1 Tax=Nicrophorus vespilloides TaxID=110193 RepID=A0ABM1NEK3_NICVS|nr:PREDICTED: histone-lysine N-methyltransferase SETMAR-like isoform X2 [Nicrophorus vespilloides]